MDLPARDARLPTLALACLAQGLGVNPNPTSALCFLLLILVTIFLLGRPVMDLPA